MFRALIVVFFLAALTLADPIQSQNDQPVTFETIQPFEMPNSLSEDPIPLSTVKPQAETTTTVNGELETVQEAHTPKPLFELNPEVDQWFKEKEEAVLSAVENPTETGKAFASKTMNGLKMLTTGPETVATKAFYGLKTVASGTLNGLQSIASDRSIDNPTEAGKAFASKTMNGLKMLTNGLETVATKAFYGLKTVASGALSGLESIASTTMDILGNYLNK